MRGRTLPEEPGSDGPNFYLKIRGGPQRRFRASDKVKVKFQWHFNNMLFIILIPYLDLWETAQHEYNLYILKPSSNGQFSKAKF